MGSLVGGRMEGQRDSNACAIALLPHIMQHCGPTLRKAPALPAHTPPHTTELGFSEWASEAPIWTAGILLTMGRWNAIEKEGLLLL